MLLVRPPGDGAYPPCPWLTITGTDCPFCGGLRATAALAHGDLAAAADYNLLAAVAVPLVVLLAGWAALRGPAAQPVLDTLLGRRSVLVLAGVTAVWFVVRLLPVAPWLTSTA